MTYLIKNNGDVLLSEGIFFIIVGLLMIYFSQTTTVFLAFFLSIGLIFIGIYRIINSIILRKNIPSPFLSVMTGVMLSIVGLYLIFHPIFNIYVLTIASAIYLLIESINSFSTSIFTDGFKQIFWISLFSGLVQLLLSITIVLSLPYIALWFLGMMLGINFIFAGITSISGYSYIKQIFNKYIKELCFLNIGNKGFLDIYQLFPLIYLL